MLEEEEEVDDEGMVEEVDGEGMGEEEEVGGCSTGGLFGRDEEEEV